MEIITINGTKYRRVPLEFPDMPTTRQCGVVEYPDDREEKHREGPRHYCRIIPKESIIRNLYIEKQMTIKQMADQSIKYFGANVSRTKLAFWMKKYGISARSPHDPVYLERMRNEGKSL